MSQQQPPAICLHQGLGLFNHHWINLFLIGTSDMILGFLVVRIQPCHIQPCRIRPGYNWPFPFESFNLKTPFCKFLSQVFHLKTTKHSFFLSLISTKEIIVWILPFVFDLVAFDGATSDSAIFNLSFVKVSIWELFSINSYLKFSSLEPYKPFIWVWSEHKIRLF